jgi:hypothetical protein
MAEAILQTLAEQLTKVESVKKCLTFFSWESSNREGDQGKGDQPLN